MEINGGFGWKNWLIFLSSCFLTIKLDYRVTCCAELISFSKYFSSTDPCDNSIGDTRISPVDTGRKLKVHKAFRRRLMYVQFTSCVYWNCTYRKYKKKIRKSLYSFFSVRVMLILQGYYYHPFKFRDNLFAWKE